MGLSNDPLKQLSDADLDAALEWCQVQLAEHGNLESIASIAAGDAREVVAHERHERAGRGAPPNQPRVRWPYQRAEAMQQEDSANYRGPRSAQTDEELRQKINAAFAAVGVRL